MTESQRAVFLSYASQDAEAARRICEALRAAGLEVWFDQSELRGGDAWDRKIRHQIRDCTLFLPIISTHSQARLEGYFRREWKLAVERTYDMAEEKPFLVPIVIDGTHDADAKVPDAFRAVQWTHLPLGEVRADFTERLSRLLGGADAQGGASPARAARDSATTGARPASPREGHVRRRQGAVTLVAVLTGAAAVGYLAYERLGASKPPTAGIQASGAPAVAGDAAPVPIPQKSIAVLPFIDLSEKKDQQYFSDGLSEELLDLLAQVPDLSVAARTSSFYFKDKAEDVATIGKQLRVAHVLEGSVRKAGGVIRVTAQLIRADNGYHVWSKTYDRDVKDIFKVQDEIASAVVDALKARLLPTQELASRHQTANPEAYAQYLLGNQYRTTDLPETNARALAAYKRAIALDPGYSAAYGGLAEAEWRIADQTSSEPAAYERAAVAADKSIELAPGSPEGYAARAELRETYFHRWREAQADYEKALSLDPNYAPAALGRAQLLATMGRMPEAIAATRVVREREPLNVRATRQLGRLLLDDGQFDLARNAAQSLNDISPDGYGAWLLGDVELLSGRPAQALTAYQDTSVVIRKMGESMAEFSLGHAAESQRALDDFIKAGGRSLAYQIADVYAWRGQRDLALTWLERAYAQHDGGLVYILGDRWLIPLRGEPRYQALVAKMGLPG